MFGDLNKVQIIGNLGKEPELRYTPQGTPVATFSVACNRNIKKGDNWEKETEWFRVVVWREQAESASKYLAKGKRVYIEGRLQTRKWDDKGVERYTTEVIAENIILLEKSGRGEGGPPLDDSQDPQPWKQGQARGNAPSAPNPFEEDERDLEDIPF
jgi:single-strand DNA-binding protein